MNTRKKSTEDRFKKETDLRENHNNSFPNVNYPGTKKIDTKNEQQNNKL